jgi:hypothetical protein
MVTTLLDLEMPRSLGGTQSLPVGSSVVGVAKNIEDRKALVLTRRALVCYVGCALLAPSAAWADGGAPLLLLAGPAVFVLGQVWIVLAEAITLRVVVRGLTWQAVFGDVVMANLRSLLLIGLLLPVAVSGAGWLLGAALGYGLYLAGWGEAGSMLGTVAALATGWVYDSPLVVKTLPYVLTGWFLVSFILTVKVEADVLRRRWEARGERPSVTPRRASWMVNSVSYAGLAIALVSLVARLKWFR